MVTVPGANPGAGTIFKSGVDVNGCTPDFQSEGGGSIPPHRTNLGGRSMASYDEKWESTLIVCAQIMEKTHLPN